MEDPRAIVLAYLRAVETTEPEAIEPFLHEDVQIVEHPNRIVPRGATYDRAGTMAAAARGRALLSAQRYRVREVIAEGERVVALVEWTGTLAHAAGPLPAGAELRAQICSVVHVRDGKIWRQEQYDCYAP